MSTALIYAESGSSPPVAPHSGTPQDNSARPTTPPTRKPSKSRTKELTLPMGRPNGCFENAITAVFEYPQRLVYVEGFIIDPNDPNDLQGRHYKTYEPIHHAWCVDKITGKRHEITIEDPAGSLIYIGKEFTLDEVHGCDSDQPIECPDDWTPQLTMAEQSELLTGAGYEYEADCEWRVKEPVAMKAGA
jgi:hypothetical protein